LTLGVLWTADRLAPVREAPEFRINDLYSWVLSERPLYREVERDGRRWVVPAFPHLLSGNEGFAAAKAPGTFRIICVGQSTTKGTPFEGRGGYPEWLSAYLKDMLPQIRTEVINAGVSSSDSTRDLAIVREALKYGPDLLVLYEGNNENGLFTLRNTFGRLGRLEIALYEL
jgi:hypothetical protein